MHVQATCEHSVQTVPGGKETPQLFLPKNSFSSMTMDEKVIQIEVKVIQIEVIQLRFCRQT